MNRYSFYASHKIEDIQQLELNELRISFVQFWIELIFCIYLLFNTTPVT